MWEKADNLEMSLDLKSLFHLVAEMKGKRRRRTVAISAYKNPATNVHCRLMVSKCLFAQ